MKIDYPESAWDTWEFLRADDLSAEEIKKLRRRIEDLIRKDKDSLFLVAAVLVDHERIELNF